MRKTAEPYEWTRDITSAPPGVDTAALIPRAEPLHRLKRTSIQVMAAATGADVQLRSIFLLWSSLPVLVRFIFFTHRVRDNFFMIFHPSPWFPFVVMLNILYPSEQNGLSELKTMAFGFLASSVFLMSVLVVPPRLTRSLKPTPSGVLSFSILFVSIFTPDEYTHKKDEIYFWSMVMADVLVLFSLVFSDLRHRFPMPEPSLTNPRNTKDFKYQVICILLISPFLESERVENSAANSILFRSFGAIIIVLLYLLPWLRITRDLRIRVLNLSSSYFLILSLLVFDLGEFQKYGLMNCLKFVSLCSFFVFYWKTPMRDEEEEEEEGGGKQRDEQEKKDMMDSATERLDSEEIVEEMSLPSVHVFPEKKTRLEDPIVCSPQPRSDRLFKIASEIHEIPINDEERHLPVNMSAKWLRWDAESASTDISPDTGGYVRDCILYCSLFHIDHEFTKDILIWSWMAAEIIPTTDNNEEIEILAVKCFDSLVESKRLVQSGYDSLSDQMQYKLVHGQNRTSLDTTNIVLEKIEHLSFVYEEIGQDHFGILNKCSKLKTLVLHKCNMSKEETSMNDVFIELKLLKILDLSDTNIKELTSSVGNLRSLKFLDMSRTLIRWLPSSIDSLSNLETLILLGCKNLDGLPRGMSKLTRLKHLATDIRLQLHSMPPGIGKLTTLQTLKAFPAGRKDGNRIEELRDMNKLRGSLCICKLENVRSKEEAKMGSLCDKQYLTELEFLWSDIQDAKVTAQEEILDNLRPHFGLEKLRIGFYSGGVLPSWISNPSFTQMVNMTLSWCRYCVKLPCLGELPKLQSLSVINMEGIVDIDNSFCRGDTEKGTHAFPQLERLSFEGMSNLVKWTGVEKSDFPCLVHVEIKYCPKLVSLPEGEFPASVKLLVKECPELRCEDPNSSMK